MIFLTLTGKTMEENRRLWAENQAFADGIELRADFLLREERAKVCVFPKEVSVPVILTCRKIEDGGCWADDEAVRTEFFRSQRESGFSFFDFEENFDFPETESLTHFGIRVIRSRHDFCGFPSDFSQFLHRVNAAGEIPKAAVTVSSAFELSRFFEESRAAAFPKIVLAMGEFGFASRILTEVSGSMLTFCSVGGVLSSLGQISPKEAVEVYRCRDLNRETAIFGVTGNPLSQSRSPQIHNQYLAERGLNAVFLPFPAVDFNDFLALAKTLSVRAAAVTVPFKEAAAYCADEASFDVKSCGASNSLIFHRGRIEAYNTDIGGFLKPLTEVIPSLKGKKCLVFGAGGAAAACVCALADRGADVTVLNRTVEKAQRLATRFGCAFGSLEDAAAIKNAAILVQASAAGMTGFEATDPAAAYVYSGNEIAYDIVYKPRETPFLKRAAAAGCRCLYGLEMLEAQARLQFDLFYSPECGLWDERDI